MNPRQSLRTQLAERAPVLAPGVYDGLSAALVRNAGFSAAYMTGAGVAASVLGRPDIGLTTLTEMRQAAERITAVLGDIPLIADADTGFGNVAQVYRTVGEYERAGVSAIQLEDQAFPKRCGHLDGKEVIPAQEFAAKLHAAQEARTDEDFLIIARTDALAPLGFDEALRRAKLYAQAGADLIFVEAPQTMEQIRRIPGEFDVPCLFNDVPRGHTPAVDHATLAELGYGLVIAPGLCNGAAAVAIDAGLRALRAGKHNTGAVPQLSPHELFDALGLPFWEDLRQRHELPVEDVAAARA
ncbi:oxaloacetate decarboxylase [Pseudonocardia sp. MH-G8]|uniref:isocitrate lyase/PEP mutase family protein n=1 Tax=Pseudonocardia sp. MH-G8 TaxID=1854588 RepID=UPI000B9FDB22|nr:isocitrate lyase/PEP mutase family protein [Pseudonocardia sp. MH-G8]OZM78058.1 carboxyvinyl-carboxyphosphonate phosphorylmutase [Pseudonocardia sp. MH-G8]